MKKKMKTIKATLTEEQYNELKQYKEFYKLSFPSLIAKCIRFGLINFSYDKKFENARKSETK